MLSQYNPALDIVAQDTAWEDLSPEFQAFFTSDVAGQTGKYTAQQYWEFMQSKQQMGQVPGEQGNDYRTNIFYNINYKAYLRILKESENDLFQDSKKITAAVQLEGERYDRRGDTHDYSLKIELGMTFKELKQQLFELSGAIDFNKNEICFVVVNTSNLSSSSASANIFKEIPFNLKDDEKLTALFQHHIHDDDQINIKIKKKNLSNVNNSTLSTTATTTTTTSTITSTAPTTSSTSTISTSTVPASSSTLTAHTSSQLDWTSLFAKWNCFSKEFREVYLPRKTAQRRAELVKEYSQDKYKSSGKYIAKIDTVDFWQSDYLTEAEREDYLREFACISHYQKIIVDVFERNSPKKTKAELSQAQTNAKLEVAQYFEPDKRRHNPYLEEKRSHVLSLFQFMQSHIQFLVKGNLDASLNPLGYLCKSPGVDSRKHVLPDVYTTDINKIIDSGIINAHVQIINEAMSEMVTIENILERRNKLASYVENYFSDLLSEANKPGADKALVKAVKAIAAQVASKVYGEVEEKFAKGYTFYSRTPLKDAESPYAASITMIPVMHAGDPAISHIQDILRSVIAGGDFSKKTFNYYTLDDINRVDDKIIGEYVVKLLKDGQMSSNLKISGLLVVLIQKGQGLSAANANHKKKDTVDFFMSEVVQDDIKALTPDDKKALFAIIETLSLHPADPTAKPETHPLDHSLRYLRARPRLGQFSDSLNDYSDESSVYKFIKGALMGQPEEKKEAGITAKDIGAAVLNILAPVPASCVKPKDTNEGKETSDSEEQDQDQSKEMKEEQSKKIDSHVKPLQCHDNGKTIIKKLMAIGLEVGKNNLEKIGLLHSYLQGNAKQLLDSLTQEEKIQISAAILSVVPGSMSCDDNDIRASLRYLHPYQNVITRYFSPTKSVADVSPSQAAPQPIAGTANSQPSTATSGKTDADQKNKKENSASPTSSTSSSPQNLGENQDDDEKEWNIVQGTSNTGFSDDFRNDDIEVMRKELLSIGETFSKSKKSTIARNQIVQLFPRILKMSETNLNELDVLINDPCENADRDALQYLKIIKIETRDKTGETHHRTADFMINKRIATALQGRKIEKFVSGLNVDPFTQKMIAELINIGFNTQTLNLKQQQNAALKWIKENAPAQLRNKIVEADQARDKLIELINNQQNSKDECVVALRYLAAVKDKVKETINNINASDNEAAIGTVTSTASRPTAAASKSTSSSSFSITSALSSLIPRTQEKEKTKKQENDSEGDHSQSLSQTQSSTSTTLVSKTKCINICVTLDKAQIDGTKMVYLSSVPVDATAEQIISLLNTQAGKVDLKQYTVQVSGNAKRAQGAAFTNPSSTAMINLSELRFLNGYGASDLKNDYLTIDITRSAPQSVSTVTQTQSNDQANDQAQVPAQAPAATPVVSFDDLSATSQSYFALRRTQTKTGNGDASDWSNLDENTQKSFLESFRQIKAVQETIIKQLVSFGQLSGAAAARKKSAFDFVKNYLENTLPDFISQKQFPSDAMAICVIKDEIIKLAPGKEGQYGLLSYIYECSDGEYSQSRSTTYRKLIGLFDSRISKLNNTKQKVNVSATVQSDQKESASSSTSTTISTSSTVSVQGNQTPTEQKQVANSNSYPTWDKLPSEIQAHLLEKTGAFKNMQPEAAAQIWENNNRGNAQYILICRNDWKGAGLDVSFLNEYALQTSLGSGNNSIFASTVELAWSKLSETDHAYFNKSMNGKGDIIAWRSVPNKAQIKMKMFECEKVMQIVTQGISAIALSTDDRPKKMVELVAFIRNCMQEQFNYEKDSDLDLISFKVIRDRIKEIVRKDFPAGSSVLYREIGTILSKYEKGIIEANAKKSGHVTNSLLHENRKTKFQDNDDFDDKKKPARYGNNEDNL